MRGDKCEGGLCPSFWSRSPLTAANFEETGKARAAWCRDGYPLWEAFPLLPHLTLLFLSLYVVPLPILLSVWHWHVDKDRELTKDRCSACTERTMCWHGDEEDEDSAEVKCCSAFAFLSSRGPICRSADFKLLNLSYRDFSFKWGYMCNKRVFFLFNQSTRTRL